VACLDNVQVNAVALHEARKDLKRMRAALWLARPMIGVKAADAFDRGVRDVGRLLSRYRETDALIDLLDGEAKSAGLKLVEVLHSAVRLHHYAVTHPGSPADRPRDVARARRALRLIHRRLAGVRLRTAPPGTLESRVRKAYRRARRAYRLARTAGIPDAMHDWRKRAKTFLNQTRLLALMGGTGLTRPRRELTRLDELLGHARDCEMLAFILRGVPAAETPLKDGFGFRARLEAVANARNAVALQLGAGIFRRGSRSWVTAALQ
jgi:hypothetical protein